MEALCQIHLDNNKKTSFVSTVLPLTQLDLD